MIKDYPGEQWKKILFGSVYTNDIHIEVSNYGRLRSFTKIEPEGRILKGAMVNGYKIIRLKLYKPLSPEAEQQLQYLKEQIQKLQLRVKELKKEKASSSLIAETTQLLSKLKLNFSAKTKADKKQRTVFYHSLIHRLVADYFLAPPAEGQTVVSHIDFNKMNNRSSNLKWMTPEENYEHQQHSPYVMREKLKRKERDNRPEGSRAIKLSVTKVMLMKKLMNQGKPMKQLVKQFKVTETQLYRIKRGENWADIEAAK